METENFDQIRLCLETPSFWRENEGVCVLVPR
jgi:hypothetical protein